MPETHGPGTPPSDPHADPHAEPSAELTPEQLLESKLQKAAGKEAESVLNEPEDVAQMVATLSDPKESFSGNYSKIQRILANSKVEGKAKTEADENVKAMVMRALENSREKLREQQRKLEEKITKKREALEKDPEITKLIENETAKLKDSSGKDLVDREKRRESKRVKEEILEEELQGDLDVKALDAVKKLLEIAKNPPTYIEDAIETRKKAKTKAAKKKAEEERKKAEAEKPHAAGEEEPKDMHVKDIGEFTKVSEIRTAEDKWNAVVNDLKRKPKKDETLYWKSTKNGELEEIKNVEVVNKYWAFQIFIARKPEFEKEASDRTLAIIIDLKDKTPAALGALIEEHAEEILTDMTRGRTKSEQALIYDSIGVADKAQAFEKFQNILHHQLISSSRKGKNVYEQETDRDGHVQSIDLKKFLERHEPFGEKMVSHSQEILLKLYKQYGAKFGDMPAFRTVFIEVIKSKGGKAVGTKLSAAEAREMYTTFLISKDPHINEKEIVSLLISFIEKPPYVIDLVNTTDGWVPGSGRKDINVLEDFCIDGSIYNEVKTAVGMSGTSFNEFIIKIAPMFERIRSVIRGKELKKEEVKLEDINSKIEGVTLTEADLTAFRKLMTIPLWPDKVGHAYKHALYLSDEGKRSIPLMCKIEGADSVKEINVLFVNVEEKIRRIAERLADERLDQELKEVGPQGWRQLWRIDKIAAKFWKRNAAEGYRERYREEYIRRLKSEPQFRTELMRLPRDQVKPGGTIAKLAGTPPAEGTRATMNAELDSIAERFGIAWSTGDTQSYLMQGEERQSMEHNMENAAIQTAIRDLCRLFADGHINDDQFRNRVRSEIIPQIQALQDPPDSALVSFLEESMNPGTVDANKAGLLDKLRAHRAGLMALDLENLRVNIKVGRARNVDVKTEVKSLNWSDRLSRGLVERLQRNQFLGRFINPTTVAVMGYGLANITTQVATSRFARYGSLAAATVFAPALWPAIAGIAAGSVAGGAFTALRQNKETLRLKAIKERRAALGHAPEEDTKGLYPLFGQRFERRLEINGGLYHKVPAEVLRRNIETATTYPALQHMLADAIALNDISEMGVSPQERERMDLISFGNETNIEQQRFQLLRAISLGTRRLATLGAGHDVANELRLAVANTGTRVIQNVRASDETFRRFKFRENVRAGFIGGAMGAAISSLGLLGTHQGNVTNHLNLTPSGPVNQADLQTALTASGLNPTQVADIQSHIAFDPTTHALTPASVDYIRNTYHVNIAGNVVPGAITHITDQLHSGGQMSQAELVTELHAKNPNLNINQIAFDSNGHMTASGLAYLKSQNVNINEVVISAGGGNPSPANGWNTLKGIHFNDNQPHAPRSHVLDELHFWWKGKPQIGADGNYHFTMKGMFDPKLGHSNLPSGVGMPTNPSDLRVALQLNSGGKHFWKMFPVDSSGDIALPPEYFDQSHIGAVARGGDTLPGLKTDAIAAGFYDQNGTFQVLASVKGEGGYHPSDIIKFTGDITKDTKGPDITTFTGTEDITTSEIYRAAIPPVVGAPMRHLEYGEAAGPKNGPDSAPKTTGEDASPEPGRKERDHGDN